MIFRVAALSQFSERAEGFVFFLLVTGGPGFVVELRVPRPSFFEGRGF